MLSIRSRNGSYTVEPYSSFDQALSQARQENGFFSILDNQVESLYRPTLARHLAEDRRVLIAASEQQKSLEHISPVVQELLSRGIRRNHSLLVIGGGVTQDVGCFIASILFRGLNWIFIPTTLLAQADSCIGSKSSINVGGFKNQIGTFFPPKRVLLATDLLQTLPHDEFRSGIGEVIKLHLIAGKVPYQELVKLLGSSQLQNEETTMTRIITRSLAIKKEFIETDEFDRGPRNILNFGHTFGHAFESVTNFAIPHGIAVLLGILAATHLSRKLGLCSQEFYSALKNAVAPWCRPFGGELQSASVQKTIELMGQDKKTTDRETVVCILIREAGLLEKRSVDKEGELSPALKKFFQEELEGVLD